MSKQSLCLWEDLPPEILLNIFTNLPSLDSLYSLLLASPHATHFFEGFAAEVFDAVLDKSSLYWQTKHIIRISAHIQDGRHLPSYVHDLRSFQDCILDESITLASSPDKIRFKPSTIPPGTSVTLIRNILASAARISILTCLCLDFFLDRFNSTRPLGVKYYQFRFPGLTFMTTETVNEPNLRQNEEMKKITYFTAYPPEIWPEDAEVVTVKGVRWPWSKHPEKEPLSVHHTGHPVWIEEQKVLRAFWRIQLIQDLKNGLCRGFFNTWTNDLDDIQDMDPIDAYGFPDLVGIADPILGKTNEESVMSNVREYLRRAKPQYTPNIVGRRPWPEPERIQEDEIQMVQCFPLARTEFYWSFDPSWRAAITFEPFNQLGFSIWGPKRMNAMCLLSDVKRPNSEQPWASVTDCNSDYDSDDELIERGIHRRGSGMAPSVMTFLTWLSFLRKEDLGREELRKIDWKIGRWAKDFVEYWIDPEQ